MCDSHRVEDLTETLTKCLAALDEIGAQVAAAHVDAALHALRRQFDSTQEISTSE
ncbi:hypothetical protein HNO88_003075 [Novosphingobium chloroacetimidivorans]|uniref:Uncharacterized protein n=1 Tax=Novosphingobium chloroacetimidivorans TaxID=1428314 RepID=A0A7W7NWV5_9SPHN|nr:hypothetical protein [Novosphingobium chloroacetimidivorans]MBB4859746.1 hypothetical protein [Novosphingobium chloroacetimidivorans]